MSDELRIVVDGRTIPARRGQTILEAADLAGVYIPHLCHLRGLLPHGSCRICVVSLDGRTVSSCTQPVQDGMLVASDTPELNEHRRLLLELLFAEGNHFCMSCERSGNCELQALGYRFGIGASRFPLRCAPHRIDASHPDVLLDRNRCVRCARCVRTSAAVDGRHALELVGRGIAREIEPGHGARLADTALVAADRAPDACPVGALLRKGEGFAVPIGRRRFDHRPIGSEIEERSEVHP
jgi:[NiFe] hydrogenase diaphorase moiety small subunit